MSNGGQKRKSSPAFHFLAGLSSGVTTAFLLQPADLLKTRVQQSRANTLSTVLRDILNGPNAIQKLWRGTTPSVIRTGAGSALYFGLLNQMRQSAAAVASQTAAASAKAGGNTSSLPKLSNMANLGAGAMARTTAGLIMSPVTVLKVRYESSYYAYNSLLGAARDIAGKEGIRGFFAGFGATAVRDAPYAGLYVLFYEQAKARLSDLTLLAATQKDTGTEGSVMAPPTTTAAGAATINFASGTLAAIGATGVTNPFDAIKTRLQLMPAKYGNMIKAARIMVLEDGMRSFFDGLALRMGRKAISSALAWTVYEEIIRRAENNLVE